MNSGYLVLAGLIGTGLIELGWMVAMREDGCVEAGIKVWIEGIGG